MAKIKAGGWQQLSSTTVYENPWIKVSHEKVLAPSGKAGIYGLVHMKNHAVGVIPLDDDGNTWLVRQSRYTLDDITWEIPEGGASSGEDLQAAAQRELEEEVGLKAGRWETLLQLHTSNSVTDECATIFVATQLTLGKQQLEATEDIEVRKLTLDEAIAMVMRGEITDAMSVAGLLRLALTRMAEGKG